MTPPSRPPFWQEILTLPATRRDSSFEMLPAREPSGFVCDLPSGHPEIQFCRPGPCRWIEPDAELSWNPLWSNNPEDYIREFQTRGMEAARRDAVRASFSAPAAAGTHSLLDDYREFFSFSWWQEASTGQRVAGAAIALVAGVAIAGAFVLGGELLVGGGGAAVAGGAGLGSVNVGAGSLMFGGSVLTHETAYFYLATRAEPNGEGTRLNELIGAAQRALEQWHRDRASPFDYGFFLLEAEMELRQPRMSYAEKEAYRENWNALVGRVRRRIQGETDPFHQLAILRQQLYLYGQTGHYRLRNSGLMGMLNGEGGNCAARAQLVLAMVKSADIRLPRPWVLGLQSFRGHVEAVAFNPETRQTLDLRTGAPGSGLAAHLYHSHIFPFAFLQARRVETPVRLEELRLAAADSAPPAAAPNSNEALELGPDNNAGVLDFPDSPYPFAGSLPEEAFDPPPSMAALPPSGAPGGAGPAPAVERPPTYAHPLSELQARWGDVAESLVGMRSHQFSNVRDNLVVREQADADYFNTLTEPEDRYRALNGLLEREVRTALTRNSPALEGLRRLGQHPESFLQLSNGDRFAILGALEALRESLTRWHRVLDALGLRPQFQGDWEQVSPELAVMTSAAATMVDWIESDPRDFLDRLADLDRERTHRLLNTLAGIGMFAQRRFPQLAQELRRARWMDAERAREADPASIGPALDLPRVSSAVAIEFWTEEAGAELRTGVFSSGESAALPPLTLPRSVLMQTLLFLSDLLHAEGDDSIYQLWDPAVSRTFLRENREGIYDSIFMSVEFLDPLLHSRGSGTAAAASPVTRLPYIGDEEFQALRAHPDLEEIARSIREHAAQRAPAVPR